MLTGPLPLATPISSNIKVIYCRTRCKTYDILSFMFKDAKRPNLISEAKPTTEAVISGAFY